MSTYASLSGTSMGTTWSLKFRDQGLHPRRLQADIQAALDEIVAQMSTWDPDSAISRLNRAEPGWYQVAPQFFKVLNQALELARSTQGAYDPTLGALVDLWGFGPKGPVTCPPSSETVQTLLSRAGWQRTALNAEHRGVWQPGHLRFDLSSIAKGFGVDEMARVLEEAQVADYLVELGGELKARGVNEAGRPWAVDIESPDLGKDTIPVMLHNTAIATSGHYRRHFVHQGRRYAHTLHPHSGKPLADDLVSVSVIHPQCMLADGLATALLCLGTEQGLSYARQHQLCALFIFRHGAQFAVEWTNDFATLAQAQPVSS